MYMKRTSVAATRWGKRAGLIALLMMLASAGVAQTAGPANLETGIVASLQQLQAGVQALQPGEWKTSRADRADLAEAQQSLQRNLQTAVPALMEEWRRAPQNLSPAFRLYRDLDALYQVSLRLSAAAGQYADGAQGQAMQASVDGLHERLQQLGDYIQSTAGLQYRQIQQVRSAPAPVAAPRTLIIDDANGGHAASPHHKTPPRKKAAKRSADSSHGAGQGL